MSKIRTTILLSLFICATAHAQPNPAVLKSEFIFERASFPSAHASTVCEVNGVLVAAWFGGSDEGEPDVGIWLSRNDGSGWSAPVEAAHGRDDERQIQLPCWNPVLFQPKSGPLLLFYKVGPSPSSWWGMMKRSVDVGQSWSEARLLSGDILGPIRCKPVELDDGTILSGSSSEDAGWRVHLERSKNNGKTWSRTHALNSAMEYGAIQPTILKWPDGHIQILCRTKQEKIVESVSRDQGLTWTRFRPTELPNPNAGIDAVMLRDGRALLVYNHTTQGRGLLNVAVSTDGRRWEAAAVLEREPGSEFSYPAAIQSSDGLVHVTYTWKRQRIKHAVIDPLKLVGREIVESQWP